MERPSTLIFDFDGTLGDTFGIALAEFKKIMEGRQAVDQDMVERLRGMPAGKAFKAMGVKWWQLPRLVYLGRKKVRQHADSIKTFEGMLPVLERLRSEGFRMMIVSSNSTKNINKILRNNKMDTYFGRVYGGTGLFDKASALRKITKENKLKHKECCYIGDEARDIVAARRAGIESVGVTWGFNNRQALEAAKPDNLVDTPQELLRLFVARP